MQLTQPNCFGSAPVSQDTEQLVLARNTVLDGWSENQTLRMQLEAATLRVQVDAMTLRMRDKDEEIRDLQHRLNVEGEERRKLTLMLLPSPHAAPPQAPEQHQGDAVSTPRTPHPVVQPVAPAAATPKKSGFWPWRRRRE